MNILVVFGTRPEAIKVAPLIKLLEKTPGISLRICVTAQHRQMLDSVTKLFDIKPHYDLNIMKPNQDLADVTAFALKGVSDIVKEFKPHWVFVQGDTTTAYAAAAMAAFYHKVPVAHLEAGLRTGQNYSPFPEEMNRKLIDQIAELHFAPTSEAQSHLKREGIRSDQNRRLRKYRNRRTHVYA